MSGAGDRRTVLLRWLPVVGWMAVIFTLSSISGLRVSDEVAVDRPIRILAHMASFGLLAGLVLHALAGRRRPPVWHVLLAIAIAVAYGVSDEIHQAFVPNRMGRAQDVAVDALGATLGAMLAWLVLTLWSGRGRGAGDAATGSERASPP